MDADLAPSDTVSAMWSSDKLVRAFPASVQTDARAALAVIPGPINSASGTPMEPVGEFTVLIGGEAITIPSRIYNQIPASDASLSRNARTAMHCLLTRHYDGYQRQRSATHVLGSACAWVVPYVIQLIGEYVIEIHETIHSSLIDMTTADHRSSLYAAFIVENPEFINLTRQRAISYWNRYYRSRYPDRSKYPALELLDKLEQLPR